MRKRYKNFLRTGKQGPFVGDVSAERLFYAQRHPFYDFVEKKIKSALTSLADGPVIVDKLSAKPHRRAFKAA